MASDGAFRLIQVHDDEELVVHAGSGRPAGADETQPAVAAPSMTTSDAAAANAPAGHARSARQEELRRRAQELERAEAGLANPKAHAGTHRAVIIGLIVLVLLVVALSILPHLG